MAISSSNRSSHAPPGSNVNLYCAQCEAQIGIFENEWIRLTSSYARSKEKGMHFGTEIGTKTQVVPPGVAQRSAEGCEMAEVFCRKCSNMVGQYCKHAPDEEKQSLVDQYFYKLSRTFLKDSRTNEKVHPSFDYDESLPSQHSSMRHSVAPTATVTPARWNHTPLRQSSSTPVSVQTATRSNLRQEGVHAKRRTSDTMPHEHVVDSGQMEEEIQAQNAVIREQSGRMSHHQSQLSRHEAQLQDHEARIAHQRSLLSSQVNRINEHEKNVSSQFANISEQTTYLRTITAQLITLQKSIDELKVSMLEVGHINAGNSSVDNEPINASGDLESVVRTTRGAQSNTHEVLKLRRENEALKMQFGLNGDYAGRPMDRATEQSTTLMGEHHEQVLGKRKRQEPGETTTFSGLEGSKVQREGHEEVARRQRSAQVPTPQPSNDEQSPPQAITSTSATRATSKRAAAQAASNQITKVMALSLGEDEAPLNVNAEDAQAEVASDDTDVDTEYFMAELGSSSRSSTATTSEPKAIGKARSPSEIQAIQSITRTDPVVTHGVNEPPQHTLSPSRLSSRDSAGYRLGKNLDGLHSVSDKSLFVVGSETQDNNPEASAPPLRFGIVNEDPSVFDDNVEFSDEDHSEAAPVIESNNDSSSGLVNDENPERDLRSMAPEPGKRKMVRNVVTPEISLDRIRIGTPLSYWSDIMSGREPKLMRPPPKRSREFHLNNELTELGLTEWIGKRKNTKEYRTAVTEARAKHRNAKKAAVMKSMGLDHNNRDPSAMLPEQVSEALAAGIDTSSPVMQSTQREGSTEFYESGSVLSPSQEPGNNVPPQMQMAGTDEQPSQPNQSKGGAGEIQTREAMTTRARTRRSTASLQPQVEDAETDVLLTLTTHGSAESHRNSAKDIRSKRKSAPASQTIQDVVEAEAVKANNQAQAKTSTSLEGEEQPPPKKRRGRPRKSAPAALGPSEQGGEPEAVPTTVQNEPAVQQPTVALQPDNLAALRSANLEKTLAYKQRLLEKMRAKAQQREQVEKDKEEALRERERLVQEAMERAEEMMDTA